MSKDGILIRKIKNFNINSNNYNNNINISQKLSTAIPMNKLRDKLKNKHIKINIRKKNTNQIRNKDQKEIINNFEENNDKNEIKTSIKGKDSINKIVTNFFEHIKLKNYKYFSNLNKINNTNYNPYYKDENYKIQNYGNLSQKRYYHKRLIKNNVLKLDINNNINFTLNNNLKNIITICNIDKNEKIKKITKNGNPQIKKYDSNTNINLTIPLKYEKKSENNLSNNKIKEIKKIMYSPYDQIKNQSLNRFIYNNEKIKAFLNQLENKKLQNNSKVISSSKKTRINYNIYLNKQNKFNKNRIDNEFN